MPSRNTLLAGAVAAGAAGLWISQGRTLVPTRGPSNIEEAFTRAGGAPTHTPARASKLGDPHSVKGDQLGEKGVGSKYFQETHGEAKPPSSGPEAKLNQTLQGGDRRHSD